MRTFKKEKWLRFISYKKNKSSDISINTILWFIYSNTHKNAAFLVGSSTDTIRSMAPSFAFSGQSTWTKFLEIAPGRVILLFQNSPTKIWSKFWVTSYPWIRWLFFVGQYTLGWVSFIFFLQVRDKLGIRLKVSADKGIYDIGLALSFVLTVRGIPINKLLGCRNLRRPTLLPALLPAFICFASIWSKFKCHDTFRKEAQSGSLKISKTVCVALAPEERAKDLCR